MLNGHTQRFASARTDNALHIAKAVDGVAIYRDNKVARLKACRRRRAAGLYGIDPRAHRLLAVECEYAGEDYDRQNEIRRGASNDDGYAFEHGLEHESTRPLVRVHVPRRLTRHAGNILVAKELYETAERDGGYFPARAVAVVETEDFGTEADGKHQNLHATPSCNQKVPKLVEEHHQAEDEKKGNHVADDAAAKHMQMRQNVRPHNVTSPPAP